MAGRWDEQREREWRSRGYRRGPEGERWQGGEDRSFDRDEPVFGERDTGAGYNRPPPEYPGQDPRTADYRTPDWQDRDYEGVSPAMQRGEYGGGYGGRPRFQPQDYTRGGRAYGDDTYGPTRREAYGRGGGRVEPREFEDRAHDAGEFFRRTGQRISSWFSDIGREDNREQGYRGLGPKGYKRSDERINDDAHQHLTDDPWLDASGIDVAVSGGEVTLSGTVATRDAKHRAEHLVEDLYGVTHVQNNLRVRQAASYTGPGEDYGPGIHEAQTAQGDASMETSANATHTTSRRS
jgi:hypothetical protein